MHSKSTHLFKSIAARATRIVVSCPNSRYSSWALPVALVKLYKAVWYRLYNEHQTNRSISLLAYTEPRTGPKSFLDMCPPQLSIWRSYWYLKSSTRHWNTHFWKRTRGPSALHEEIPHTMRIHYEQQFRTDTQTMLLGHHRWKDQHQEGDRLVAWW